MLQRYELTDHWIELKTRLFLCVLTVLFFTCLSYTFAKEIYDFLTSPLLNASTENRRLIFTGLTEAFFTYMKVACYSGLFLSLPLIMFQLYSFMAPGLYEKEKKYLILIVVLSPILFWLGAYIVYYFVMPLAWKFFISFEDRSSTLPIILEAKISDYLDLTLEMIIGFGLAFQLPIVTIILAKIGLVSGAWLAKRRKYAIVFIFIIAAVLTPPDVISQITLAVPLLLLYEFSIVICKIIERNKEK